MDLRSGIVVGSVVVLSWIPGVPADLAGPDGHELARRELGVREFVLRDLEIPGAIPDAFRVTVEHEGRARTLSLSRRPVRGPGFLLLLQDAGGALREVPPPPARTYRGIVEGEPETEVAASLLPGGLRATAMPRDGASWHVGPRPAALGGPDGRTHVVYRDADLLVPSLAGDAVIVDETSPAEDGTGSPAGGGAADGACVLRVADLAFDTDHEYFDGVGGGEEATATAILEDGVATLNVIYERDLRLTHRVSAIILRPDPATDYWARYADASSFGSMLGAFRDLWESEMGAIDRDMAYYVTGKGNPEYGGLAFVRTTCGSYAYGMGLGYSGFVPILRHELGHNWGAGHECGLERGYIMCGNSMDAFSAFNVDRIGRFASGLGCLDTVEATFPPEAPFTRPDFALATAGTGPLVIDVLRGDTDRNCDDVRIASHDERSAFGAEIHRVDGVSPGGPEALLYLPRSDRSGTDSFGYVAADGTGFEVRETVFVRIVPGGLVGHWPLDGAVDEEVPDSSGNGHDGELRGALSFETGSVPGTIGGALRFTGDGDDYVSIGDHPAFGGAAGITVSAWIRVDGFRTDGESVVAKGGSAWRLQRDGTRDALKFTCTGVSGVEARGNVPVADGRWHHAAGVWDGTSIRLYIDGALDASVPAVGSIASNGDSVHIGDDWSGEIDDVRIHDRPLAAGEVAALRAGSRIEEPRPADGATGVNPGAALSWLPAPGATAYDVYLGTSRSAVEAASPASPERLARTGSTTVEPTIDPGTTYWWRIDPVSAEGATAGPVRRFVSSFAFTSFDEPRLQSASFVPGAGDRELGFTTTSTPTGGDGPLAAVVTTGSTTTSPVFSQRSVAATTRFEAVPLEDRGPSAVSLILQARDTGYEADDSLEAYVTDAGRRIDLVRARGGPPLTQVAGGGYESYAAAIPADWASAVLVVSSSSDSSQGSERYDFDEIGFSCDPRSVAIAGTLFREPAPGSTSYDPGPGATELGFSSSVTPTGGASPVAGVIESEPSGPRRLAFRSVAATTTFDAVDVRGEGTVEARVVLRVLETGYESGDVLEVSLTRGADRVDLIRLTGATGLGALASGEYRAYRSPIPAGWESASLVVECSSNSGAGSEGFELCAVEFVRLPRADCSAPSGEVEFRRGDVNADLRLDLSDGIRILNWLFLGAVPPECVDAADSDDSGTVDLSDGIRVFNFLFLGGPPPAAPGHLECGADPTADSLSCPSFPGCP